ncbi:uncharacterized protein CXorf65 homolog isoform X1 [Notamacropus eugenii]|uniref:uncharacterized protein CXorf65 homolog isoform X1 n=1 Tax=Notamacropus eugenii TaxID=9315 RepID=UPI003B67C115
MFITILHGDHEKTLFNSYCKVEALLNSIKQCCGCEPEGIIELADENGQLKNLRQHPHLYASELLKPRETYIPFTVTRPEGSSEPVFVALLKDDEVIDSKLLEKHKHSRSESIKDKPCAHRICRSVGRDQKSQGHLSTRRLRAAAFTPLTRGQPGKEKKTPWLRRAF